MNSFEEIAIQSGKYRTKLLKLGEPLFQTLGINYFYYVYISHSRQCSFLGSNPDLIQHYVDEKMHFHNPYFLHTQKFNEGLYLYDSFQDEEFQTSIQTLDFKYDTKHCCILTKRDEDGYYIYGFSIPPKRRDYETLLINQSNLLRKFINYFELEMNFELNKIHDNSINLTTEFDPKIKKVITIPQIEVDKSNFLRKISKTNFCFTSREKEVIHLFLKGKNARDIGECLFLSKRTVEYYLDNIKNKVGCSKKSELFEQLANISH